MSIVRVSLIDHATAQVQAEPSVVAELSDVLAFEAPGAAFDPRVKKGQWDGMIHLMDRRKQTIPAGLADRIKQFCVDNGYEYQGYTRPETPITEAEVDSFLDTLDIPERFDRRDYQVRALTTAIRTGRQLMLSPTSSGKSMIIYTLLRWYKLKTLIIVPTVGLVHQFASDLADYGCPLRVHKIHDGKEDIDADVVVSTWQSIFDLPPEWFDQFGLIVGDEAHNFTAQSLTGIMMKARRTAHRFGFTGTLRGAKVHQLQLEGLFGPVTVVTTTRELMDRGYVAQLDLQCVVLKHPKSAQRDIDEAIKEARKKGSRQTKGALSYQKEIQYIYGCEARNKFIVKMATRLKGNVLVLFHHVEHGQRLFDMTVAETNRPVHLIDGGTDGLERDEIRGLVDGSDDSILIASVGTSSTGISIRRINHLITASPWKARVTVLQSIGRGLRLASDKNKVTVYDLADDISVSKGQRNHTMRHMAERIKTYSQEQFDYQIHSVELPY